MAKADDTSSTMIWLRDALALAVRTFGSVVLTKERLREWLAAGELPWSCMSWKGLDAEGIARLDRENQESIVLHIIPSAAYRDGDPQFWRANLTIHWEENEARENATGGARALGIRVSRTHVRALLPGVPDGNKKVGPQMRRVLQVLKKLYPPHGKVPDDVSTEVVRARVNEELAADSRNRELAAPSWDTVKRALGRG
jgi:hypothetical protein